MNRHPCCAVILAAGMGTRMGDTKQLLEVGGKPMLQHVVDAAAASSVEHVVVVLGHDSDAVATALRLPAGAEVVVNRDFARGQSTSLTAGLEACSEAASVVVLMGDQPEVTADLIDTVLEHPTDLPVVRARFSGAPGHPVLIEASVWPAIRASGDAGARDFLAAHPELVDELEIGRAPLADVDSPKDLAALTGKEFARKEEPE